MIDKKVKSEAFFLRSQGYTYKEINNELGIAKSTLNDWFSEDGRQKTLKRNASLNNKFRRKVSRAGFKIKGIATKDIIEIVQKRNFCYLCGAKINIFEDKYDLDHIHPKSKGGSNKLSNLHPSCSDCNYLKGNLSLDQLFCKIEEIKKFALNNIEYTYNLFAQNIPKKNIKKYVQSPQK